MKKLYLLLLLATVFVACKKDMDVEFSTFEVEDEKFVPSYTSTELSCKVRCTATINQFYLQYDTVADFATYQEVELVENEKTEVYSVKIGELLDNTTYYVRYVAVNSYSQVISEEVSEFKTLQATAPTIEVREITDVLDTIATVGFVLKFNGGADVTKMGVCWSVDSVPIINGEHIECSSDVVNNVLDGDSLVLNISGLEGNTTYYVRAYAENMKGVGYSESKEFVTLTLPEVETEDVTDIQLTSGWLNGEAIFDGNDTTTIYGFCWGEVADLTIEDSQNVMVEVAQDSTFTYRLSNLEDETKYYVRAYAKNKIGIVYGDVKEFTTQSTTLPIVVTSAVTEIEYTSAVVTGSVTSDGGAEVTERGVCYSKTQNPTISDTKIILGKGFGYFLAALSDLQDETTYFVRAYAINKKGVSYGKQISFETKTYSLPMVEIFPATNINYTSAIVRGNVKSDGLLEVIERGVCYSTSENPTILNDVIVSGEGVGNFVLTLDSLEDGVKYYVRAYAKNSKGIAYSENITFMTKEFTLPIVEIISGPTKIGTTEISGMSFRVVTDGGSPIVEMSLCFKETSDFDSISSDGMCWGLSSSEFDNYSNSSIQLDHYYAGFREATTYYMRVYARNQKGIGYSQVVSFTTKTEGVDLGLSVKWAKFNIGASSPEEDGYYFAWGEVKQKTTYDWSSYKYCAGSSSTMTKYCNNSSYGKDGFIDNKIVLDLEDDVAYVNWGGAWRMPTNEEMCELIEECTWTWTTQNGVNGYKVVGPNGNSIFLPAVGYMSGGTLYGAGSEGYYWSSSLDSSPPPIHAICVHFHSVDVGCYYFFWRGYGCSVRPVCQ